MESKIDFEDMLDELVEEMHEATTPPEGSFSFRQYHERRLEKNPELTEAQTGHELERLRKAGRIKKTDKKYSTGTYGMGYYYYFVE